MAKTRYLLSTGKITTRVEYYILDIFRINLTVMPEDVPLNSSIGFDYSMATTTKDQLVKVINTKLELLTQKIRNQFPNSNIHVSDTKLIDEQLVVTTITVNNTISEDFNINIYNQDNI